jgi:hypothetical protein
VRRAAALLLVAGLAVAACADDPEADYCNAVEERQQALGEVLAAGDQAALLEALPIFRELAKEAPSDIRDEWQTVIGALTALEEALEDAGVDPATYERNNPPPGLSQEEKDRIDAAAAELANPRTSKALSGVEQQARDVCQTPLFL